jgi:hypothetical protein
MPLDTKHPDYEEFVLDWERVRDCYAGERVVKNRGQFYLPPTRGMILDGMVNSSQLGWQMYEAYRIRAVWHDLFKEAVEAYIGLLHYKSAQITLPESMKDIRSNEGETPQTLLRRINEEQLITGRLGLLTDLPAVPDQARPLPYITMYTAENVCNWDTGEDISHQVQLRFVVLNESGLSREDTSDVFSWTNKIRYRVCSLGDIETGQGNDYRSALYSEGSGTPTFIPSDMKPSVIRGKPFNKIPFSFVNSKDGLPAPDQPPLIGLANMMFAIYRGEADYRQNLFMQGQDTLVTIGTIRSSDSVDPEAPLRTGAGSRIDMDAGGDAKYIGVNSAGLPEQRQALGNDRQRAEVRAGQLVNARLGDKESGDALRTRLAAQTATLKQIALTGGASLEAQLKDIAVWMGEDPNKVKVEPNEEFSSDSATGQDISQLMDAKDKGAPISYESIHEWMVDKGYTKRSFKEDFDRIVAEKAMIQVLMNPILQGNIQKDLDNKDPKNKPSPALSKPV